MEPERSDSEESQQFGEFTLLSTIGEGSSAEVFLARQVSLDFKVALKRWRRPLSDADREAFLRECQLQQQLSRHPNIVRIRWAEAQPGERPWIAMDLYEMTLQQRLEISDPIPLADAFRWADEILAGLAAVHEADHVHRDVKTANVLLADGVAALGDLGISMRVDASTSHSAAGTAGFVAPELANNGVPTFRSDVYSAGVTVRTLFGQHATPAVEALLTRATSHDPQDRPADAGDFRRQLAALRPADVAARTPPSRALAVRPGTRRPRRLASSVSPVRRRRRRLLVIPLVVVTCAVIIVVGVTGMRTSGFADSADREIGAAPATAPSRTATLIPTLATTVSPSPSAAHTSAAEKPGPTNQPSATGETAGNSSKSRASTSPTKPATGPAPTPSTTTQPSPPKTTSEPPKSYVEVPLSTDSSVRARLYFGQLKPVVAAMSNRIDPGISRDIIENNASRCAATVVFSRLDGATGVVYAERLVERGWGTVEYPPSKQVSGDRAVRQQIVVPPDGATDGQVWTARAALEQNGAISDRSSYYTLQLTDTQGSQLSWLVNRSDVVSCSAY